MCVVIHAIYYSDHTLLSMLPKIIMKQRLAEPKKVLPTRPAAHATSRPRDQSPTRPAQATSPSDQPMRPVQATSPGFTVCPFSHLQFYCIALLLYSSCIICLYLYFFYYVIKYIHR